MDSLFIIGTGRSGTHFTCRSLRGFNNVFEPLNGKENGRLLKNIALSSINHKIFPQSALNYYKKIKNELEVGKIFLDQHHPNIFYITELNKIFSGPIFLYPQRPIVQIVASMLNHQGVLSWFEYAKRKKISPVPIENQFLGIQDPDQLKQLKLHELCALRVIAHQNRAILMKNRGFDVRFLNYENLVKNQLSAFESVFSKNEITSLGNFRVVEESNFSSLRKFEEILSSKEIIEIRNLEKQQTRLEL